MERNEEDPLSISFGNDKPWIAWHDNGLWLAAVEKNKLMESIGILATTGLSSWLEQVHMLEAMCTKLETEMDDFFEERVNDREKQIGHPEAPIVALRNSYPSSEDSLVLYRVQVRSNIDSPDGFVRVSQLNDPVENTGASLVANIVIDENSSLDFVEYEVETLNHYVEFYPGMGELLVPTDEQLELAIEAAKIFQSGMLTFRI